MRPAPIESAWLSSLNKRWGRGRCRNYGDAAREINKYPHTPDARARTPTRWNGERKTAVRRDSLPNGLTAPAVTVPARSRGRLAPCQQGRQSATGLISRRIKQGDKRPSEIKVCVSSRVFTRAIGCHGKCNVIKPLVFSCRSSSSVRLSLFELLKYVQEHDEIRGLFLFQIPQPRIFYIDHVVGFFVQCG